MKRKKKFQEIFNRSSYFEKKRIGRFLLLRKVIWEIYHNRPITADEKILYTSITRLEEKKLKDQKSSNSRY